MRNSPLKGLVREGNSQGLSPTALKAKRKRDKEYMMGPYKKKKAFNQRWHRANPWADGLDYDHKDNKAKTEHANRGNDGKGTKNEKS